MKKKFSTIRRLFRDIIKITPISFFIIMVCYIFSGFYPGMITFFSEKIFLSVENIKVHDFSAFYRNIIWFSVIFLIKNILDMVIDAPRSCGIYTKVSYALERNLAIKLSQLPYISFENTTTYEAFFTARQTIKKKYFQRFFFATLETMSLTLGIVNVIIILCSYHPFLVFVSFLCIIPQMVSRIIRGNDYYSIKMQQMPQQRQAAYYWSLFAQPAAIKEMRSYNTERLFYDQWKNLTLKLLKENMQFIRRDGRSLLFCRLLQNACIAMCIGISIGLIVSGSLKISEFAAMLSAIIMIQTLFKSLLNQLNTFQISLKFINNYYDVIDMDSSNKKGEIIDNIQTIRFCDVSFKYPMNSNYSIMNASFTIKKGETVVIVGENGSGKTTLAKLILGLYDPIQGEIIYGKTNSKDISKEDLFKKESVLSQNFIKYRMSLLHNITIADPNISSNIPKTKKLLRFVKLDRYADDQWLNVLLGKEFGGAEFSGGEWQRLAIARALYKKCDLLVLDEPTSALDPNTESEILKNFADLAKGEQTTVIISHRMGLCSIADRIIVVKGGQIVGEGKHEQLYEENDYYKRIFDTQKKWYI